MTREDIVGKLSEFDSDDKAVMFDEDYDDAVVGYEMTEDCVAVVVYSHDKLVELVMQKFGSTREDSEQMFMDFERSAQYAGTYRPRFLFTMDFE